MRTFSAEAENLCFYEKQMCVVYEHPENVINMFHLFSSSFLYLPGVFHFTFYWNDKRKELQDIRLEGKQNNLFQFHLISPYSMCFKICSTSPTIMLWYFTFPLNSAELSKIQWEHILFAKFQDVFIAYSESL